MRIFSTTFTNAARAILATALLGSMGLTGAQAQGLDLFMKGLNTGAMDTSGLSSLGSLATGSMGSAAGVIEYCLKNNYLSGTSVSQVKDGLMGKMPGGKAAATLDSGYLDGTRGLLTTSDGKKTDLTSGMTDSIKKQACDFVLIQGRSML